MIIRLIIGQLKKKKHCINELTFSRTKIVRKSESWITFVLNYAPKTNFKNSTGIDISSFTKTVHLADLKPHVEQLDGDKLKFFQLT